MEYHEWLKVGLDNGWCGPPVCYTHDGLPATPEEEEEMYEYDPCIHIIRMYDSDETKMAVEKNHSPSVWRKPYEDRS